MEKRESKDRAARLLAYTAAAGLGAFGAAQTTQASVVYTDIPDITLYEDGAASLLDLNDDGIDDVEVKMLGQTEAWFMRFRAEAINGSEEFTNLSKGNPYYIRSFEQGDVIGNANANCVQGALNFPVAQSNTLNFGNANDPQYMGVLVEDAAGDTHWGWIRMRYVRDGVSSGVGYAVVYDYAYETDLASVKDIVAPEPGSLGLLAVGAGALAFRRRK